MKQTSDSQHRNYFNQHQLVEFEQLLIPAQLQQLKGAVSIALTEKTGAEATPQKLFEGGRDLWRAHDNVRKIVGFKDLARIASELLEQSTIRLGYDMFFPGVDLMGRTMTLQEMSSLQGVICGLMVCLEGSTSSETEETPSIFARKAGNGVYFRPELLIDFSELNNRPGHSYLLIVYVQASTVYIFQENDPHAHAMKSLGYSFGDKLSDKLNPILIR